MSTSQVQQNGIFHGLPVFPDSITGLTAIITGANGISGHYMLRVLSQSPKRWKKIYCLSRRPPLIAGGLPSNVEHVPVDFMVEPDNIAKVLKENSIQADYVFFFSYIQPKPEPGGTIWSNATELSRVNTLLLTNFLEALPLASIKPHRIMLQTGAKNYGIHLGPAKVPSEESDPRVLLEPNFYYPQEDYLWAYCKKYNIGWNVVRPSNIIGAVPDAAMNLCFPLAVFAAVSKHLGEPLAYPGDVNSWEQTQDQSSAMLNGYLEEWAILSNSANNEAFNACDSSSFTWGQVWPKVAALYGMEYKGPDPNGSYQEMAMPHKIPPRRIGTTPPIRFTFVLSQWAKRPDVQAAWKELAAKHDLRDKELRDEDRIFGFIDNALLCPWQINFSMDKARKLGWNGFVDSTESIQDTMHDFVDLKMIPPVSFPRPR